jgi:ABC-2 type transport system permease protein
MNKIWTVTYHEFMTNLKRREFLYTAIGMPIFIGVLMAVVLFITISTEGAGEVNVERVGYIDQAGILQNVEVLPEGYHAYDDAEQARADLDAEEIDAYFVVPPAYMLAGQIALYSYGTPSEAFTDQIEALLDESIVANLNTVWDVDYLREPVELQVFLENSGRTLSQDALIGLLILPAIFAFVFVLALQLTSTFLMSGIVEEKTNRIMEVLVTSITPAQLLLGKLFGLGALGLLQLFIWALIGVVGFVLFGSQEALSGLSVPLDLALLALVYFILMYFLFASILAGIGALSESEQESRQIAGLLTLVVMLPFFFFVTYFENPDGTIPTLLTFIPFTSGLSVVMRASYGTVPFLELLISLVLLVVTTLFITWASARIFRWALLLYGKKPGIRMLWRVLRRNVDAGVILSQKSNNASKNNMKGERA